MAEEKKIICGGFLVGEGLDIDGKTLYATGGGGNAVHVVHLLKQGSNYVLEEGIDSLKIQDWLDNDEDVIIENDFGTTSSGRKNRVRYYRFGYSSGGNYPSLSFYEILKTAAGKMGVQWLDIGWTPTGDSIIVSSNEFTPDP